MSLSPCLSMNPSHGSPKGGMCEKEPRRTVDLKTRNQHSTRETHYTQSPIHQARSLPCNTKKTIFDCWNGYHSVASHPKDHHFTTFITPWGRYCYRTALQGYIAVGFPEFRYQLPQDLQEFNPFREHLNLHHRWCHPV